MRAELDPARLEAFLARLYVDSDARSAFLRDRVASANAAGLSDAERESVLALDASALELAARSFSHKRSSMQRRVARAHPRSWFRRFWSRLVAR